MSRLLNDGVAMTAISARILTDARDGEQESIRLLLSDQYVANIHAHGMNIAIGRNGKLLSYGGSTQNHHKSIIRDSAIYLPSKILDKFKTKNLLTTNSCWTILS